MKNLKKIKTGLLAVIVCTVLQTNATAQNFNEIIKSVASDRATGDQFGYSVDIDGNYAIVGAPYDDFSPFLGAGKDRGAAYLFVKDSNSINWIQQQKIIASDWNTGDLFGFSVSISGNRAIVGAYKEDANEFSNNGAAYIFERNANENWSQVNKLIASDANTNDNFGYSVAIDDDYAIVGAYGEDGDTLLNGAGAAYIFKRDSNIIWIQQQKIVAPDRAQGDAFGVSVSISDSLVVVGAPYEDHDEAGINFLRNTGSVYAFKRNGNENWQPLNKIVSDDRTAYDQFGNSVDLKNGYAIIGAPYHDLDTSAQNISNAGAAYIFESNGTSNFVQLQKLTALNRVAGDWFGSSVSISANHAIAGARYQDSDTNQQNILSAAGAAYVFYKNTPNNWIQSQKIIASDRATNDRFGSVVALSGNSMIIGAPLEDENVLGGSTKSNAGSVYFFEEIETTSSARTFQPTTTAIEVTEIPTIKGINLYPNPSNGAITIALDEELQNVAITIFDMTGKTIYTAQNVSETNVNLSLEHLDNGIYFVNVNSNSLQETIKFVKQ